MNTGFKMCGRDILGLDGCFMKGPYPGQILTAVSVDSNNGRPKCDIMLNNICEVFNKQLVGGRDKPIITCLEFIREYMMKRIVHVHKLIAKAEGPLTPRAAELFQVTKDNSSQYTVMWNGAHKYQVSGPWNDQCIVDAQHKTCTCRRWELTGLPCRHAVAVNWDMAANGIEVGLPESWVSEVYWVSTWKKVYENTVDPINGRKLWIPTNCPSKLLPPKHHKQIGRPKKKRKKSAEEASQQIGTTGKLPRKGNTVKCGKCKGIGHNKKTCTGQPSSQTTGQSSSQATGHATGQFD